MLKYFNLCFEIWEFGYHFKNLNSRFKLGKKRPYGKFMF